MYTLIYLFIGPATNHCSENWFGHSRTIECPNVHIISPQVVAYDLICKMSIYSHLLSFMNEFQQSGTLIQNRVCRHTNLIRGRCFDPYANNTQILKLAWDLHQDRNRILIIHRNAEKWPLIQSSVRRYYPLIRSRCFDPYVNNPNILK